MNNIESNNSLDQDRQDKMEIKRRRNHNNETEIIKYFYRYSDYSTQAISEHLGMPVRRVQEIVDELIKMDALEAFVEESSTRVEKIMSTNVMSLDYSETVVEAAALIAQKEIGSVIVTKRNHGLNQQSQSKASNDLDGSTSGRPYGIVTERDIVRRLDAVTVGTDFYFQNALLGHICSHPLIAAYRGLSIYDATEVMINNRIRKLPILNSTGDHVIGIVTTTDLAMFLSPSKRPGLVSSLLKAMTRGRTQRLTVQKKRQPRPEKQTAEEILPSNDQSKHYICRKCFEKFDNIEDIGKHMLTEHHKKGEIF